MDFQEITPASSPSVDLAISGHMAVQRHTADLLGFPALSMDYSP